MTLLLCSVTVPPSTGNFNILCAVDGTARIFLMPLKCRLHIIALCWDGDLITMKFIHADGAMFIQDFRGCSAVNIYPMHKMSAHFGLDDHWTLRTVFFPQRWKGHCRFRREALGNPGLGHSFPWLDHQYS
ncbi:hypothetical protein Tco_0937637 [Tanacetum coccineum]|uniref:Uncharacterized protein n=1 Tax=Tanacetum coccineum TaxID=301880 RepID=A0ABQ5DHE9_9ASTR